MIALTFSEEFWLAIVQGTFVVSGVVGGFAFAAHQARRAFDRERERAAAQHQHEREVERDRQLRLERLDAYRKAISAADGLLAASAFRAAGLSHDQNAIVAAEVDWRAALADIQLVGSVAAQRGANEIDAVYMARSNQVAMIDYLRQRDSGAVDPATQWKRYEKYRDENLQLRSALTLVCHRDITVVGPA